jgi:hypothetical protein
MVQKRGTSLQCSIHEYQPEASRGFVGLIGDINHEGGSLV